MSTPSMTRASEGATARYRTAGLWRRGLSMLLDAIPAAFIVALGFAVGWLDAELLRPPHGWFWTEWVFKYWLDDRAALVMPLVVFFSSAIAWTTIWEAWSGRSPGARVARLLVVDRSAFKLSATRAVLRGVGAWLNLASLGLGYLWILVSSYRRGWHDYLAGTLVIRDED